MVCLGFIFRHESSIFLLVLYIVFCGGFLALILVADKKKLKIKRFDFIDKVVKGHLRKLRDKNIIINISFKAVEIGFIFLLLFSCFMPQQIHIYLSLFSVGFLVIIVLAWKLRRNWAALIIDTSVFFMIPFVVYLSEKDVPYLKNTTLAMMYALSFGVLVIFVLLTLKFTRRKKFKTTTMDFLILFICLVVPYLPEENIRHWQVGLVAAKIVVLFFTYEVLKAELRMETKKLRLACIVVLIIIGLRGFVG
jgi:UDP-GlcNAc:undecaprenyl-phosphate GlcNAc-1-phosphate transferase